MTTIVWCGTRCWRRSIREAPVRWWAASCVVGSAHGWLGAVGFAASAHRLDCRDRRLGRRQAARLPAPGRMPVAFPVLASNAAISPRMCWAVWSTGWETRRATATARLETFENRHAGTSFRAANRAGETAGRGRQGRNGDTEGCIRRTGGTRPRACCLRRWRPALESWAEQEFGGAPLGDARLSARLVTCARHQAEAPMRAFTGAAKGDRALIKAYYRFIDKPGR